MKALDRLRLRRAESGFDSSVRTSTQDDMQILARPRAPRGREVGLSIYLKNKEPASEYPSAESSISEGMGTAKTAKSPRRWIDRPDVIAVVEDLRHEGMPPWQIARTLGLYRGEVLTILDL